MLEDRLAKLAGKLYEHFDGLSTDPPPESDPQSCLIPGDQDNMMDDMLDLLPGGGHVVPVLLNPDYVPDLKQ